MKQLEFHLLLRRILICTYILVRQGKSQCIQCNQTGLSVLGQPLTITCSIIAPVEDLISVRIYKDQTNLLFVPIDYAVPKPNVTFFEPDAGKRLNVVVKDTSETSRSVSVVFGNLECQDNGTYEWVLRVSSRKVLDVTQQQHVIVKVYPQFNSFDIFPITIMPDSNLYQGDVVTLYAWGTLATTQSGHLVGISIFKVTGPLSKTLPA
ncbi:hypothetical protein DPMN_193987 [Dreissena polymorpha]|uniref:Uncharacterized protein n=1 Tax=Dreissena polymorpha TaxID=45954 RepID=A0A9D4B7J7_DREPO|nr:hypothetical protein DPMN_193987 [Dreissena polymorpha]